MFQSTCEKKGSCLFESSNHLFFFLSLSPRSQHKYIRMTFTNTKKLVSSSNSRFFSMSLPKNVCAISAYVCAHYMAVTHIVASHRI